MVCFLGDRSCVFGSICRWYVFFVIEVVAIGVVQQNNCNAFCTCTLMLICIIGEENEYLG